VTSNILRAARHDKLGRMLPMRTLPARSGRREILANSPPNEDTDDHSGDEIDLKPGLVPCLSRRGSMSTDLRLARLEESHRELIRQLRRWKSLGCAAVFLLLGWVACGAAADRPFLDERGFRLIDSHGAVKASLQVSTDGEPVLILNGTRGKTMLTGYGISVFDVDGKTRASLGMPMPGEIEMAKKQGLSRPDAPVLTLYDKKGNPVRSIQ
jgi:hypothetical protein